MEPYRIECLPIFSTVLWHLKDLASLSLLAHEVLGFEKALPHGWCILGNCFSLQKDHENALKFFERARQIDDKYAYAYILSGFECLFGTEDFEQATIFFRQALTIDDRQYLAWYGLGLIASRHEKYEAAQYNFSRALAIFATSSVLHTQYAIALHKNKKTTEALSMLKHALVLDSNNTLAKYKQAAFLATLGMYQEALKLLNHLEEEYPREAPVFYLKGKLYKKLDQPDQAIQNFVAALDLDAKNGIAIKSAIENIQIKDENDDVFDLDGN